ncbi:MAG: C40 family peptidase [Treponema sp.]|jgi:probable lipoprotein NlpC|nr:C40 family peptidase [Treponema sp.]
MKSLFSAILVFCAAFSAMSLYAAPLEGGFSKAPKTSASLDEKVQLYLEARYRVIDAAEKYEKTPYLYGGLDHKGVDCSGLIFVSFRDAIGVSLPRSCAGLYSWAEKIPRDRAQPGDLLFFKTDNTGKITHVALYLGEGNFIHAASAGPDTGVIYSHLDERYWSRTFVGAGRAFPEDLSGKPPLAGKPAGARSETNVTTGGWGGRTDSPAEDASAVVKDGRLLLGVAIAPTWNAFLKDHDLFRGFASQLHIKADTYTFGPRMVFGMEIRPEYDGALGVFRLPLTFSWGPSEKIMIFAGPVFSFGDASLSTDEGVRHYSGGTNWIGAAGITAAPFIISTESGDFAPYLEAAWQYYFSDSPGSNPNADFSAGFRFSTGLRWTFQVR